ncbi:uncharacterized protein LOC135574311 [Oncorhynchus nerka]|uniref:uncharacterized protein LOC135574311 n=1 Tax=Oncorhynchus nerka TaxID=8023 RepID=UPI0031B7F0F7
MGRGCCFLNHTVARKEVHEENMDSNSKPEFSWSKDSVVKKAQQRLFNLRRLKKFGLSPKTLTNFYRCTIESILSGCITAWYGNCSAYNLKALQRVVRSAQRITGGKLPALQDTYTTRCHRKAKKIIKNSNHPSHCLFTPLSSRRREPGPSSSDTVFSGRSVEVEEEVKDSTNADFVDGANERRCTERDRQNEDIEKQADQ